MLAQPGQLRRPSFQLYSAAGVGVRSGRKVQGAGRSFCPCPSSRLKFSHGGRAQYGPVPLSPSERVASPLTQPLRDPGRAGATRATWARSPACPPCGPRKLVLGAHLSPPAPLGSCFPLRLEWRREGARAPRAGSRDSLERWPSSRCRGGRAATPAECQCQSALFIPGRCAILRCCASPQPRGDAGPVSSGTSSPPPPSTALGFQLSWSRAEVALTPERGRCLEQGNHFCISIAYWALSSEPGETQGQQAVPVV